MSLCDCKPNLGDYCSICLKPELECECSWDVKFVTIEELLKQFPEITKEEKQYIKKKI